MFVHLTRQMPYRESLKRSDSLSFWLFIAAVIHAIVLIGVVFVPPKPQIVGKAIEVTIVNSTAKRAPENAKYFAQNNQIAAGLEAQKPMPVEKKKPSSGENYQQQQESKTAKSQTRIQHRLITQKNALHKLTSAEKHQQKEVDNENTQSQPELSMEELDKQIAQLGAKVQEIKESSEKTRVKSMNAISAHRYVAAQYVKDWERKVERIGNLNYPKINGSQDFSGTLSMDVGVNADGSIYDIKIVKSSGTLELDEAAKRIVNMSAPFAPLPEPITKELDVLRIRRVWSFSSEGKMTPSDL